MKIKMKTAGQGTIWMIEILVPHPSPWQGAIPKANHLKVPKKIYAQNKYPNKSLRGPKVCKSIWSNIRILSSSMYVIKNSEPWLTE